jgi:hypothetical protein
MLESAGILSWCHRLVRVREAARDLFGHVVTRWRVLRTSNAYTLIDPKAAAPALPRPKSSKSDFSPGTTNQDSTSKRIAKIYADLY